MDSHQQLTLNSADHFSNMMHTGNAMESHEVSAMHAQQQQFYAAATVSKAAAPEKKAPRMRFSQEASDRLYALYKAGVSKPNKQLREELARELGKTPRSIQIWFQNRRAKAKQAFAHQQANESDEEDGFEGGAYKRKHTLSLNMNALAGSQINSPRSAQYFNSPYSAASYANHVQARGGRRVSIDNSSPYSPQRRNSATISPQQARSAGMYQRSPSSMQSPISHLLNDNPSFGDMMMKNETNSPQLEQAYPSPQEMQYGRTLKSFQGMGAGIGKIETSHLPTHNSSFPLSAVELRSNSVASASGSSYEPQSAMPYGSSAYPFDNIPSGENYGESHLSARSKFATTLPDLHEITSDPTKFIDWLNTGTN